MVGCVGKAGVDPSVSSPSMSSSSDPASSMSSRFLFCIAPAKGGHLERGEARWVAAVAFSVPGFWVELKLNLGAGVNCW